jgi:hypothetical protein
MAVTEITPTAVVLDTAFALSQGAGTAINAANEMEIPYPKQGKLLIVIDSDHADTAATLKAGFGVAKGLGALTVSVADTAQSGIVVSSDRLKVATGLGTNTLKGIIELDWAANSAGFVRAYYLP